MCAACQQLAEKVTVVLKLISSKYNIKLLDSANQREIIQLDSLQYGYAYGGFTLQDNFAQGMST